MKRIYLPIALLAAWPAAAQTAPAVNAPAAPTPISQDARQVAQRVDEHLRRLVPFGFNGAVLIARDGEVVLSQGYGHADRESGAPMTGETGFDIGSITKQFTAAAILKLEMQGKLNVTDSVSRWFPDVPADKRGITLHHLLTHSAGLDDVFGGDYELAERDSLAGVILRSEPLWAPGTRYRYSNSGYSLLGMVVEKASGVPYEEYLRMHVLQPAGLTRTGYRGVRWAPGELAVGYRSGARWGTPTDHAWAADGPWWNLRANGGILSTLPDLHRWHRALEGEQVLSAAAKEKLFGKHVPTGEDGTRHYGYGWSVLNTTRGTPLITHNGGNGIFFADFRRYVGEGVLVLIASSVAEASAAPVETQVLRLIFGGEYTEPPVTTTGDAARAAAAAGTYRLPGGATVSVAANGAGLRLEPAGQEAFALARGSAPSPALDSINQRTVDVLTAAQGGDFAPLIAVAGDMRPEEARSAHQELMDEVRGRLGAFRAAEIVGTTQRGSRAVTLVRLRHERGDQLLQVIWGGGVIAGLGPMRQAPSFDFVPVSETEWAGYDFATGATVRLRADGRMLEIQGATPIRAERVGA